MESHVVVVLITNITMHPFATRVSACMHVRMHGCTYVLLFVRWYACLTVCLCMCVCVYTTTLHAHLYIHTYVILRS